MKSIRFSLLFLSAIFKKQYLNIVLGIMLGVVFYFTLPFLFRIIPRPKAVLKIGRIGRYELNEIPEDILSEVSYGLTTTSDKGEILPSLAESWLIGDEGRTYRFKLKEKPFFWHNQDRFTPVDVNYNFKDVILVIDDNDIIFKLKEPFSPFPSIVSKPLFKKGLIGLGSYKVKKIERTGKFIKGVHLVPVENRKLPEKQFKFYPTENDLKTAFNLGEINLAENLSTLQGISSGNSVSISEEIRKDAYLALFFNISKTVFQPKNFRQALAYAIPKESGEKRALTPINPLSWAYNQDVKQYSEDIGRAKKLLENEAESLKNLKIVISTLPQYEKTADYVRQSWEKLGIVSVVQVFSFLPTDFDVLLIAREIPREPDQYFFWHSTQTVGNLSNLKNPRIDKLLEDGRKITDKEERKNLYYDFQRFLAEESPAVFLSHPTVFTAARNSIFRQILTP